MAHRSPKAWPEWETFSPHRQAAEMALHQAMTKARARRERSFQQAQATFRRRCKIADDRFQEDAAAARAAYRDAQDADPELC